MSGFGMRFRRFLVCLFVASATFFVTTSTVFAAGPPPPLWTAAGWTVFETPAEVCSDYLDELKRYPDPPDSYVLHDTPIPNEKGCVYWKGPNVDGRQLQMRAACYFNGIPAGGVGGADPVLVLVGGNLACLCQIGRASCRERVLNLV